MYLLDTHTLLWGLEGKENLPKKVQEILQYDTRQVYVSAVSVWEIAIKTQLGKLTLSGDIRDILEKYAFNELSISAEHAWESRLLPDVHKDPFDRLLVAQAKIESLILLTNDTQIAKYPVMILWE